jgi:hypothetical protein
MTAAISFRNSLWRCGLIVIHSCMLMPFISLQEVGPIHYQKGILEGEWYQKCSDMESYRLTVIVFKSMFNNMSVI